MVSHGQLNTRTDCTAPAPPRSGEQSDFDGVMSASECAAWRQRFAESRDCFVGFVNPDGSRGYHSCANEVVPDPEPVCGPAGSP
jgi:hypothetical protein